jgi:hypothetical protein
VQNRIWQHAAKPLLWSRLGTECCGPGDSLRGELVWCPIGEGATYVVNEPWSLRVRNSRVGRWGLCACVLSGSFASGLFVWCSTANSRSWKEEKMPKFIVQFRATVLARRIVEADSADEAAEMWTTCTLRTWKTRTRCWTKST